MPIVGQGLYTHEHTMPHEVSVVILMDKETGHLGSKRHISDLNPGPSTKRAYSVHKATVLTKFTNY